MILDRHIRIGCQIHLTSEWEAFSSEDIAKMSSEALGYWRKNREAILAAGHSHQTPE